MTNQMATLRMKVLTLGLMLAFFGYVAWSSTQIHNLESKLARVEASHYALGRYTYDFGQAVLQTNTHGDLSGKQRADLLLVSMSEDDTLRPTAYPTRTPILFVQEKDSQRNATWALSR